MTTASLGTEPMDLTAPAPAAALAAAAAGTALGVARAAPRAQPVNLFPGLSAAQKALATLGVLGFLLLIFGYLLVYDGPRRESECFRQMRAQAERDEARTQRLVDTLNQNNREVTKALEDNRAALKELTDELRRQRLAGAKAELEVRPE
jgi:hypothetical protein